MRCPHDEAKPTTEAEWRAIEEVDPEAVEDLKRRIVARVGKWEMNTPALLFLETTKPLSFIGSQALVVAEPLVNAVYPLRDYYTFRKLLERRTNVDDLIELLEESEDQRLAARAALREERRARRRERVAGSDLPPTEGHGLVGWLRRLRRKGNPDG